MTALSDRDRAILRAELAEKIDQLLPTVEVARAAGFDWRPTFEAAVDEWRAKANGCPESSAGSQEYLGWSLAHQFVLEEQS